MGLTGAVAGGNTGCGGPDRGAAGRASAVGGGPGRENGGGAPGAPAGGADEWKGGAWPKGDGLGAELGTLGCLLRFKFCILSANESGFL